MEPISSEESLPTSQPGNKPILGNSLPVPNQSKPRPPIIISRPNSKTNGSNRKFHISKDCSPHFAPYNVFNPNNFSPIPTSALWINIAPPITLLDIDRMIQPNPKIIPNVFT